MEGGTQERVIGGTSRAREWWREEVLYTHMADTKNCVRSPNRVLSLFSPYNVDPKNPSKPLLKDGGRHK